MTLLRFLQLMILNGVLFSLFKISFSLTSTSTTSFTSSTNENSSSSTVNAKTTTTDDISTRTTVVVISTSVKSTTGASVESTTGASVESTSGASVESTTGASVESTTGASVGSTTGASVRSTSLASLQNTREAGNNSTLATVITSPKTSHAASSTNKENAAGSTTAVTSLKPSSSIESVTSSSETVKENLGWIAAPVIVGVCLVVVIIVVVLLLRKRWLAKKPKPPVNDPLNIVGILNPSFQIDAEDSERQRPSPVRVQDFISRVGELHCDSDYGFASEFALLAKLSQKHSKMAAKLPENKTKNRFTNVLPFDHSRVRLAPVDDAEGDGASDYINASFVPGFSSGGEFIAAQGPMRSTVDDFWRMIWEYSVTTIVMVTNLEERGHEKCASYWPAQNDPIYYGDVEVEQISESSLDYYTIRIFSVKSDQQTRRLTQFHFLTWPDFGVPKEPNHLLSFLTQVRNSIPRGGANHPILVHCSAGIGRTGTFIAIDHVLQLIKQHAEIDVFGLVLNMRNNRPNMIQTESQYIFAHECIRYALEHGYHQGKQNFLLSSADESPTDFEEESLYMNTNHRK